MKKDIQRSSERGTADYGWLKPNYYFSFSQYHNPHRTHFGVLRVLNDDFVAGGGGFPTHPHDNMEIVTIPLTGALQHKDSTGGQGVIRAGDIQVMSAGTGVFHSEFNASATDPVTLFQIWLFPKIKNIRPRYDQRTFDRSERLNQWQVVVSPLENDSALWINQDARFSLAVLEKGNTIQYKNAFPGNGIYLVIISGEAKVDGEILTSRDSIGITDADEFSITANETCELLAIELPMQ